MRIGKLAAALCVAATPCWPEATATTLYSYKHWEVEFVQFDDGSAACKAEVDAVTDSFSIWYFQDDTFRLQFYSTDWEFGESQYADMQVRIDRRSPWSMTNAELYQNSVLFNLPDNETGVRFLMEVARGSTLYLNTAAGEGVKSYSLAGSRASMEAMIDCGSTMSSAPGNPFN